jgi:hypothetical protein
LQFVDSKIEPMLPGLLSREPDPQRRLTHNLIVFRF